jgi:hypothetical protein
MNKNLGYWIPTALFSFALTGSGFMTLTRQPPMVAAYQHLGYPLYFMTILGLAKLLGVATVLAPGLPRLKEWAYAGFVINMVSAVVYLASGDPPGNAGAPVVLLGLILASWHLRPESRRLAGPMV